MLGNEYNLYSPSLHNFLHFLKFKHSPQYFFPKTQISVLLSDSETKFHTHILQQLTLKFLHSDVYI